MKPLGQRDRPAAPAAAGALGDGRHRDGDKNSGAEHAHEFAAIDFKVIEGTLVKFVTFRFGELHFGGAGMTMGIHRTTSFFGDPLASRRTALSMLTYPQQRQ